MHAKDLYGNTTHPRSARAANPVVGRLGFGLAKSITSNARHQGEYRASRARMSVADGLLCKQKAASSSLAVSIMLPKEQITAQLRRIADDLESGKIIIREFIDIQEVGKRMGSGDVYLPIGVYRTNLTYIESNIEQS
jgi:hypothetical protein